jgi:DNA-binding HxlR family transcriptional regulator
MKQAIKQRATKWAKAQELCERQSEADSALTGEMVTRLADKWSLWTLATLAEDAEPLRFSRLMERVEGVSQKSLTKTLRGLERDGLATRKIYPEVPPRVEYTITKLGVELLEHVEPLWSWVAKSVGAFAKARAKYDER